jgi:hypothetical protein
MIRGSPEVFSSRPRHLTCIEEQPDYRPREEVFTCSLVIALYVKGLSDLGIGETLRMVSN